MYFEINATPIPPSGEPRARMFYSSYSGSLIIFGKDGSSVKILPEGHLISPSPVTLGQAEQNTSGMYTEVSNANIAVME